MSEIAASQRFIVVEGATGECLACRRNDSRWLVKDTVADTVLCNMTSRDVALVVRDLLIMAYVMGCEVGQRRIADA